MGISLSMEKEINNIFCIKHRKIMEYHEIFLEFLVMSAEEQSTRLLMCCYMELSSM